MFNGVTIDDDNDDESGSGDGDSVTGDDDVRLLARIPISTCIIPLLPLLLLLLLLTTVVVVTVDMGNMITMLLVWLMRCDNTIMIIIIITCVLQCLRRWCMSA